MPEPTTATSAVSSRSREGAAATVTSIHSERVRSCATFMVFSCCFAFAGPGGVTRAVSRAGAAAGLRPAETLAQRIHQIDDVVGLGGRFCGLGLLSRPLALDQLAQRDLILVLELARIEMRRLGIENVPGDLEHILGYFRRGDVLEELTLVAHLIIVAQGRCQDSLAERFERNEELADRDDDARESNAVLLRHGVADHREGLNAGLAVGDNVVGTVAVARIDFRDWHETIDVDGVSAFELHGLEFVRLDLDIAPLGKLVTARLVFLVDDLAGLLIDHL